MAGLLQLDAEDSELRAAFRALGALTPATARPAKDLPTETASFNNLLRRGVIREGAPGTFYLYETQRGPGYVVSRLLFWIVVIITPIVIIQFCSGSH
jgi:hypothetical protein